MAAPYIIAIDPAINTGICEGHVGAKPRLYAQRFRFGDDTDEDVFGAAVYFFSSFLKDRKPDLIAVEGLVKAQHGYTNDQTTTITRGLYGIFTGIAKAKGLPLKIAEVGTWRKFFLGRGNLKGKEAKAQCVKLCAQLGWDAPTHDAAEAAGIWCWASSQIAPAQTQRTEPLFAVSHRRSAA